MLAKAIFNLLIITIIIRYLYYPVTKNKDYLFTYFLISLTVFILCILLDNVKLELGFALGLFAIFGIIRYRTDPIPIKEMTYLFLVIGVSVLNAVNKKISHRIIVRQLFNYWQYFWFREDLVIKMKLERILLMKKLI